MSEPEDVMFARILIPLDGSHLSESVLPVAARIARAEGSTLTLLHILEQRAPEAVHGERHLTSAPRASNYLNDVAERLRADGLRVDEHTHDAPEGDVADSIVQHAAENNADLIALCTHGREAVRHRLFGGIAQQVLNRGTRPVLLVRPPAHGVIASDSVPGILVPLDGTAGAERALGPAVHLSRSLAVPLHLVMVVASMDSARAERPSATLLPAATRAALELESEGAGLYLDALAERLRLSGVRVECEVRRGATGGALTDMANRPSIGLVVVATHARTGVQAMVTGSIAAHLSAKTNVPILLIRAGRS